MSLNIKVICIENIEQDRENIKKLPFQKGENKTSQIGDLYAAFWLDYKARAQLYRRLFKKGNVNIIPRDRS